MSEIKINIDQTQDISFLIDATNDVLNATESDFAAMKQKKWYTRLWETITFSKDNQIRTANGVTNLAKLQEILVRVLVNLSSNNAVISEVVKNNSQLITQLSCIDRQLLREINKIKYGSSSFIEFPTLDIERKMQLAYFLVKADVGAKKTELSQKYIGAVLIVAGLSAIDDNWDVSVIDTWSRQEQELLYRMIITNRYLLEIDYHDESEVIDNLSISSKRKAELESIIEETAKNASPDFFVSFFDKTVENMLQNEDDILFAVEDKETYAEPNEEDSIDTYDPEKRIKEEDAARKIFKLCKESISQIQQAINTKDYVLLYLESDRISNRPQWLPAGNILNTEGTKENGLYAVDKYTGELSLTISLDKLPTGERLKSSCYHNNLAFILLYKENTVELYYIDVEGKTLNQICRLPASNQYASHQIRAVNEKYLILSDSEKEILYTINYTVRPAKCYAVKYAPYLRGTLTFYKGNPCVIRKDSMSVLSPTNLAEVKTISWGNEEGVASAHIYGDRIFLMQWISCWGSRTVHGHTAPIGDIYNIVSIDINNPSEQTTLFSNLRLKEKKYDESGWIMARFPADSTSAYEWLFFDITTQELYQIATDSAESYSEGHFSMKCTGINIGDIGKIGNMFFYKNKQSSTVGSVYIEDLKNKAGI